MIVRPDGPIPADVLIVGEAPGAEEVERGIPFVGPSGMELNRMLHEAGISRSECFVTNVVRVRPPDNDITKFIPAKKKEITPRHVLHKDRWVTPEVLAGIRLLDAEISSVCPRVIIALGDTALWALTGLRGITKWRGSGLRAHNTAVIPTIHPAGVLREWYWRAIVVNDFRRAARIARNGAVAAPQWTFQIRPSHEQVIHTLSQLYVRANHSTPLTLAFDLETRHGHIACAGLAWSTSAALCIPFMQVGDAEGYWSSDAESDIVWRLYQLLTHPNVRVVGQNLLYDCQYTARHWHFVPAVAQDTMITQHALFSDLPKGLAFLASMYCEHYVYWKDEGKQWHKGVGEEHLWHYNCQDCIYTFEVAGRLNDVVGQLRMDAVHGFQQRLFWPVLYAMRRGVRIDPAKRGALLAEVRDEVRKREHFLTEVLGHPLNPRSPKQMKALFYDDFKLPKQMTRAKKGQPGRLTLNDEALQKLAAKEPRIAPLVTAIADIRTLGIFVSTFLERPLDADGRMRCAYNIGGSESGESAPRTYRLSSSENAFGNGGNLQNIPSKKSKSVVRAGRRGGLPSLGEAYKFPNIREMFVPDEGQLWWEGDLDRADLQVVVYEADDQELKAMLREGVDIHAENARLLRVDREFAKSFVHGTNYASGPRTMASALGCTVHDIDRAQRLWFGAHPNIKRWHERIEEQIKRHHFVQNRFGYRWHIFDRVEGLLPEALAWIPQSTVGILINKIWVALYDNLPAVEVLLQVHDSLCGQLPLAQAPQLLPEIHRLSRIPVPYEDPLLINFTIKTSTSSWGGVSDETTLQGLDSDVHGLRLIQ